MVHKCCDNKSSGSAIKSKTMSNQKLPEKWHKPIIRKFGKQKVHSSFKDIIFGDDLEEIQLISKCNKVFRFSLGVVDVYIKYAWVVPLKEKKVITKSNVFEKIWDESNHKPNKVWVDKGREFYNKLMKSWLQDNDIEICSKHNEGKSVAAKRFIISFKNKMHRYMTSI